ncbi:hypothetical protein BpHYR1_001666, partial [Brachionus plicatilis]
NLSGPDTASLFSLFKAKINSFWQMGLLKSCEGLFSLVYFNFIKTFLHNLYLKAKFVAPLNEIPAQIFSFPSYFELKITVFKYEKKPKKF